MNKLTDLIINDAKICLNATDRKMLDGKSVLITGASGLVGTYLLASLTDTKVHKIYAICQSEPTEYWKKIAKSAEAKIIQGDLTDYSFISGLPSADFIIHAAGYGQPGKFTADPIKTLFLNTTTTIKLLEKLKAGGRFLFMSSSEVYSGLQKPPHKEGEIGTTNTDHPRACYIEGKRCGEAIVNSAREKGISASSARLSLAYGPGTRKDDKRAINSFIGRAITENKIEMLDSGKALRTYCYITDAVEMMWKVLFFGTDAIYNVGGNSKTSIKNLAQKIAEIIGARVFIPKIEKNISKNLSSAPINVCLDLSKIKKQFKKHNFVPLEMGLKKTIEWQKILLNNENH